MRRQYGRHLNPYYYIEVELLPDNEYFSPSDIVKRKLDKKTDPESFKKMFHSIYQFGVRNGLTLFPDNCARHSNGKPILLKNGKAKLLPGERSAKWTGKTWKSKLFVDDREEILKYARGQLVVALQKHLVKKQQAQAIAKEISLPEKRSFKLKKSLMVAVLVAAIVLTAGGLYSYDYLKEGYGVLRSDGPKAAYAFFQNRGESYDNLFGKAWAAYRNGDYEVAEVNSKRVLKSSDLKNKARASYLLGDLKTISGDFEEAKEYLMTALAIYQSQGKSTSEYRTHLFLAKLSVAQKDLFNARYYLNLAGQNQKADKNQFHLYLLSQIAFFDGDFKLALKLTLRQAAVVGGDRSQLGGIFSDIGFYYGLIGNMDQCLEYTTKAQSLASQQENTMQLMYNNINMCLYMKCTSGDYGPLRESVLAFARNTKDMKLLEQMYFVDKFTCSLPPTNPGHGDPPDDDPPPNNPAANQPNVTGNQNGEEITPYKRTDTGDLPPPKNKEDKKEN